MHVVWLVGWLVYLAACITLRVQVLPPCLYRVRMARQLFFIVKIITILITHNTEQGSKRNGVSVWVCIACPLAHSLAAHLKESCHGDGSVLL